MPILISLIVHLTLLGSVVLLQRTKTHKDPAGKSPASAQKQPQTQPINLEWTYAPKPKDKAPEPKEEPQTRDIGYLEKRLHLKAKCKHWYGGVGLEKREYDADRGAMVWIIAKGYPADLAGVRPGDKLKNSDDLRGEPGSLTEIQIERNGSSITYRVLRDKICTD